jgi:hypothetical protein
LKLNNSTPPKEEKNREDILPSNNKSLWKAVGIAKNLNQDVLPKQCTMKEMK